MIRLPVFQQVHIQGYQLYPGRKGTSGLSLSLSGGPWIVLGVNGLGKSTLLLILRHLLTGPCRLRGAGFTGERGDVVALDGQLFAWRVSDRARNAAVYAKVQFGQCLIEVRRDLKDLRLLEAKMTLGEDERCVADEEGYRDLLSSAMNVGRFEDALRILERLTFFLEDRQPLIWDVSAQFEIFRALLTPHHSQELRRLEGIIVSNDSTARNLNSALYKIVQRRDALLRKHQQSAHTRAHLAKASAALDAAEQAETALLRELDQLDSLRSDARTEFKRADREADRASDAYEKQKLDALRHAFSGVPLDDQYIFLKLISGHTCVVCGSPAQEAATELEQRQREDRCLICGSHRSESSKVTTTTSAARRRAIRAYSILQERITERAQAAAEFQDALCQHQEIYQRLEDARRTTDLARREVRKLRAKLPQGDTSAVARDEDQIEQLRREVLNFRYDRDAAEEAISGLLATLRRRAEEVRLNLEATFQRLAKAFFAEDVRLVYAPRKTRIGQGGRVFEFPAFEVEFTKESRNGQSARRAADEVSMSQREYLDIVFRMSLIETFGIEDCSFVVDGPEGSVDAVFAGRAGNLFSSFSRRTAGSNILLACNVVEGAFIPSTLKSMPTYRGRKRRIINLLDLAAPTTALSELRKEYAAAVDAILRVDAR